MSKPNVNICLVGHKFMGRAHSNAYEKAPKFFDLPMHPNMHTIVGRDEAGLKAFAEAWRWQNTSTDYKTAFQHPDVNLVDIGAPNNAHRDMAIAALEAGKHVACEKPLAGTLDEAREMRDAAKKHPNQKTYVWYSYRRCPAVTLARQLVQEGRIGKIYRITAYYLQDWAKPDVPLLWRFSKEVAGSGSHGDLGAHIIDMARFITGEEFTEITGSQQETFVKQREIPSTTSAGGIAGGSAGGTATMGEVNIDDTTAFLGRMSGGGISFFEATRFATGNQNKHGMEINGEKGAIMFNFEDMNYLSFYDATLERKVQGWQKIMVTHAPDHPYAHAWWPDAHIIGYEHTFINMAADMMIDLGGQTPIAPIPDFEDAYQTQRVLEAAVVCAEQKCAIPMSQIQ